MSVIVPIQVLINPALIEDAGRRQLILEKMRDFAPVLQSLGEPLEAEIAAWFTSQGRGTWAELSAATVRDRFRKGFGPSQPLVRSGRLLAALTERDAFGHKFLVDENSLTVGAYGDAIVYMGRLAKGDPSAHLPARMLVNVGAEFVQLAIDRILEWLGGGPGVIVYADPILRF